MTRLTRLLIVLWFVSCLPGSAEAKWVWHKEKGWIEVGALPRETEEQRYDYALALMTEEQYESALAEFSRLIREFRGSGTAEKCEMHCVGCYYGMGNEREAFRHAEAFFAKYPNSPFGGDVLKMEFAAGVKLTDRGKKRGVDVLKVVLAHQPDGPLAAQCHFEIGKYYQKDGYYSEAEEYYRNLVDKFPESKWAPQALLSASVCALKRSEHYPKSRPAVVEEVKGNLDHYSERYGKQPDAVDVSEYRKVAEGLESAKGKYEVRFYYALLDYVLERYSKALKRFPWCARKLRGHDLGGEARFYEADCRYHLGSHYAAFKTFEKFFRENPGHVRQADAAKREFEIAGVLKTQDVALAAWAYGQVVARSPYSPFADDAQMEVGNCEMALKKYEEAETAYQAVLKAYPDSEWFGAAIFLLGKCCLERSKMVNEGASLALAAEERFQDYITRYPTGIKVAEARECLKEVKELKAAQAFRIAEFYVRIKQRAAALIYLQLITRDFADTTWAARAEERAKRIRGEHKG